MVGVLVVGEILMATHRSLATTNYSINPTIYRCTVPSSIIEYINIDFLISVQIVMILINITVKKSCKPNLCRNN